MRIVIVAVASILLAAPAVAQDDPLAAAKAECAEIQKEIDAAFKEHREAFAKVRESEEYKTTLAKYRETRDEESLEKLRAFSRSVPRPEYSTWSPKFALGAIKNTGDDAAVPYLTWLASYGDKQTQQGAIETIIAHHAGSQELLELAEGIYRMGYGVGREVARDLATAIIENNDHAEILANAHFGRARNYGTRANRKIEYTPEEAKARDADLAQCVALAPESIAAMKAEGPTFEKERLQIGMAAPDIVANDLDGVEFKLSDYRGKVVVLDFWGDW